MRSTAAAAALSVLLSFSEDVHLAAQLPPATPAALATAGNHGALARGFGAIALNPAGLAMPGNPEYSLTVLPVQVRGGLGPIGFSDIKPFEDRFIPDLRKETWMRRIERAGGQSGGGGAHVTPLAMSFRGVGLQISTIALADARLNPDAAELLLFGNAGRSGAPRDFELDGSSLRGLVVTTGAIGFALPLDVELGPLPSQHFAVGATLKYTVGNVLMLGMDAGTMFDSDPLGANIRFPILQSDSAIDRTRLDKGSGIGLDVGAAWEGGDYAFSLTLQNLFHTFGWDESRFYVRPGEALFDGGEMSSDFDIRPLSEAPETLLAELRGMRFAPAAAVGGAWHASERFSLSADVRRRFGKGIEVGPRTHAGVGAAYVPSPRVPLRAGMAVISDGFQIGGGSGIVLGPVELLGSALLRRVEGRRETLIMAGLSLHLR